MASRKQALAKRASRVRRQVKAVANGRPRLSVHRSSKNIYVQVIDDVAGRTLAAASTLDADLRSKLKTGADTDAAAAVGKLVAERAKKAGVKERSEEHTSELQSLMRLSYAVFCLKKTTT